MEPLTIAEINDIETNVWQAKSAGQCPSFDENILFQLLSMARKTAELAEENLRLKQISNDHRTSYVKVWNDACESIKTDIRNMD